MSGAGFLGAPEPTAEARRLFDDDLAEVGYVTNGSRLWAHRPEAYERLSKLWQDTAAAHGLDVRQRGILVAACASTLGDSYCSLAWGCKLAGASDAETAAAVLRGDDTGLSAGERTMAAWARKVARDPNHTSAADVRELRDAGFGDAQIFSITLFVALRLAFSTVNDALGARPDAAFRSAAPEAVRHAVTYGRPIDG
jgi:alkylhydroperoxidase family enzyme